ncbi:MAG: hypothetical protein HYV42_03155 [Candidatus Magasanikbacteria bacterium]|nr:hypothetical protein [Candidatus Magasanikbacteria bacterium]
MAFLLSRRGKAALIIGIVAGSLAGLVLLWRIALAVSPSLRSRAPYWNAQLMVRLIKWDQRRAQAQAAADTVGGKTPEETLRLYLAAVDSGDYRRASTFFVPEKQKQERQSFSQSVPADIGRIQNLLVEALKRGGTYSADGKEYVIHQPIFVHLVRYPAGNWKLLEI